MANDGLIASHLWSWGSSNARWTSQTSYTSLALVTLERSLLGIQLLIWEQWLYLYVMQQSLSARKAKKLSREFFFLFLPFHPECQFQVPPLPPWDLEHLAHPNNTNTYMHAPNWLWLLIQASHCSKQPSNYLLSRGSVLSWQSWQTWHSRWSWLTLRTDLRTSLS